MSPETPTAMQADDLRAACKTSLASYKVPRHVFLVAESEVPRTGSGKVEKAALRRLVVERLGRDND